MENTIKEVREPYKVGVNMHEERIKMLRLADNIVLVGEKRNVLQKIEYRLGSVFDKIIYEKY